MLLIFSNGAKERLSFVLKFSARGQMLTSDSHCQSGQRFAGGKNVCGRRANSPLPERDLGSGEKGVMGEVLLHLSLDLFNSICSSFYFLALKN